MKDTKEFKTIDEQIKRLQARNLKFKNIENAKNVLIKYNYFDVINGFETILLYDKKAKIYKNVYFEDFYALYKFDSIVRKEVFSLISDFESRLRTSIAYNFSKKYCNTPEKTMNYIDKSFYKKPTDKILEMKFVSFCLFRKEKQREGKPPKKSYVQSKKDEKPYVAQYVNPPFWVIIKTLTIGNLYYLFTFLDDDIKKEVLSDFSMKLEDEEVFRQIIYILKEARNHCAHLELITRFNIKNNNNLNYYNDARAYLKFSKNICFLDLMKILSLFSSVKKLKQCIILFYIKMAILGRIKIAKKMLAKMGRANIKVWLKI